MAWSSVARISSIHARKQKRTFQAGGIFSPIVKQNKLTTNPITPQSPVAFSKMPTKKVAGLYHSKTLPKINLQGTKTNNTQPFSLRGRALSVNQMKRRAQGK